jgi:hypothetical protein
MKTPSIGNFVYVPVWTGEFWIWSHEEVTFVRNHMPCISGDSVWHCDVPAYRLVSGRVVTLDQLCFTEDECNERLVALNRRELT